MPTRTPARQVGTMATRPKTGPLQYIRRRRAGSGPLAARIRGAGSFASVDYLTLRDDAPKPVRDEATAELRGIVQRHSEQGRRVLVVPLLVSFGGIDRGLRERLQGPPQPVPDA